MNPYQYNQMYQQHNQGVIPMRSQPQNNFQQMNQMLNNQQNQGQNQQNLQQPGYNMNNYHPQNQQQQQFQNDIYLRERQQMQQKQMAAISKNPNIQNQLNKLNGRYRFYANPKSDDSCSQCQVYNLDIDVGIVIPVKILFSGEFPQKKPQIYVLRKLSHRYIDDNNWEVLYSSLFQWQPNSSLLDLINALYNEFKNNQPAQDPMLNDINNLKNKYNEDQDIVKLQQHQVDQIFPGINSKDAINSLLQQTNYDSNISELQPYKNLSNYVIELSDKVQYFAEQIESQSKAIQQTQADLNDKANQYTDSQTQHMKLINDCKLIKERFSSSSIMQVLSDEIKNLDDNCVINYDAVNDSNAKQLLNDYFQGKSRQYILGGKLENYNKSL